MNTDTPTTFHRRRIETLSNTLGAWLACRHTACRRSGCCRRAGDVVPACLLPIVQQVNTTIAACAAALPDAPMREEPQARSLDEQILSLNKRLAGLLEAEVEEIERRREMRRAG